MKSSYIQNNYAEIFEAIVHIFHPIIAIELGVFEGYSTYAIAKALKKNKEIVGIDAHLYAYDLFDEYKFNHSNLEDMQKELIERDLQNYVTLIKQDAFKSHENYKNNSVHFLHIDLSNTGEIIQKIIEQWDKKIIEYGIILLEGGSEERDHVDWMLKYKKPSIRRELERNKIINANYICSIYQKFPSLTCLIKK